MKKPNDNPADPFKKGPRNTARALSYIGRLTPTCP